MDITQFVLSSRDKALPYGDYSTYRAQLAHRLLNVRKRLRMATRHRGKYSHAANRITAEQVAQDVNYARLQLLTAERAFAQAMAMKNAHASAKRGIRGHTRSHVVSRLDKAAKYAEALAAVLRDPASGAGPADRLEARAYAALLRGAAAFEKQAWAPCLASYAAVWAIYRALASPASPLASAAADPARADALFRDLLTDTIEPSLRYAAYQLKMPRSKPIPIIAREALAAAAADAEDVVASVNEIDPAVLQPQTAEAAADPAAAAAAAATTGAGGVVASTRTLTWQGRPVTIKDATIASTWAALDVAKARLQAQLAAGQASMTPRDMAAAYDEVLAIGQDLVDATRTAIVELRAEGVPASYPDLQLLYIARTAADCEMISDRIGRNRILTGPHDGAVVAPPSAAGGKKKSKAAASAGRLIARLKEKVVLYDGTLQSLASVQELPGVIRHEDMCAQLDATSQYFVALKSLALARSHTLAGHATNALALVKHAYDQCAAAAPLLTKEGGEGSLPLPPPAADSALRSMRVAPAEARFLLALLQAELQRARALVDIEKQQAAAAAPSSLSSSLGTAASGAPTLGETLHEYPRGPVDLENLVAYPPRLEAIPVKPIFLDIAWNYIEYPNKSAAAAAAASKPAPAAQPEQPEQPQQPQKRGWFGFKR